MDNHQTRSVSAGLSVSTHNGNEQYWVLVDQMLVRNGPGDQDGLVALGGFVNNNANNSSHAQQYFVGLRLSPCVHLRR
jgi:porin